MAITTETPGSNSIVIKFNGADPAVDIATVMKTFLTTHGWEALDPTFFSKTYGSAYNNIMTYRALNKDGTTYKYMQIRFYLHSHILIVLMEGYTVAGQVIYNECLSSYNGPGYGQRIPTTSDNQGAIFMSASARWCIMQTQSGDLFGSSLSDGWEACFELTQAQIEDDPTIYPTFAMSRSHAFLNAPASQGVMAPVRSRLGYANNQSKTRASVPVASWGVNITQGPISTLGFSVNPFNNKHNAFDVGSTWDCVGDCGYFKGFVYGLKMFQCGIGQLGDKMRVKTNDEFFIDPQGTEKDFMIFTDISKCRIGFPL